MATLLHFSGDLAVSTGSDGNTMALTKFTIPRHSCPMQLLEQSSCQLHVRSEQAVSCMVFASVVCLTTILSSSQEDVGVACNGLVRALEYIPSCSDV